MDLKDDVRTRLSIEDVIGEYVQLKRAGRNWKGLSPFSAERTPSFVVSPEKGIWHDFSSGKGGDLFGFVMEMEGLDFRQALELLARRAGLDPEQYRQPGAQGPGSRTKARLGEATEWAARFYQAQLKQNQAALAYVLKKRRFSKQTVLEWRLGYSPNNGSALLSFLRGKGFTENEIKLAGLTSQNYRGGLQDMFRGRLQIPLCDAQGQVVGFTARLLDDTPNAPKYINTPATPLYDKSRHVFGLHLAKEAIRKSGFVVLAEGNLDVISSHQAGIRQVVATAGTALTEPHLKTLSRLTDDIRLCFDADKAGLAATERAIPIAGKVGVNLKIISIPSGKDPDELIRQDSQAWQEVVDSPAEALDWLIERYREREDLTKDSGRKAFKEAVFALIARLESSGEQSIYAGKAAEALGYPNADAVRDELQLYKQGERVYRTARKDFDVLPPAVRNRNQIAQHFMALTLMRPELRAHLYTLEPEMFVDDAAREVFEFLAEHPDFDGSDAKEAQKIAEYGKILSLVYETLYQHVEPQELQDEAQRLQLQLVSQYVRTQKQKIATELQTADPKTADALLARARDLDALLRIESRRPTRNGT